MTIFVKLEKNLQMHTHRSCKIFVGSAHLANIIEVFEQSIVRYINEPRYLVRYFWHQLYASDYYSYCTVIFLRVYVCDEWLNFNRVVISTYTFSNCTIVIAIAVSRYGINKISENFVRCTLYVHKNFLWRVLEYFREPLYVEGI